jgi:hypothetical protein
MVFLFIGAHGNKLDIIVVLSFESHKVAIVSNRNVISDTCKGSEFDVGDVLAVSEKGFAISEERPVNHIDCVAICDNDLTLPVVVLGGCNKILVGSNCGEVEVLNNFKIFFV